MFYNQDLVDEYGLDDPALLCIFKKWNISHFYEYLGKAQEEFQKKDSSINLFGGDPNVILLNMISSNGEKLIDLDNNSVSFTSDRTRKVIDTARLINQNYWWIKTENNEISSEFMSGKQLFTSGPIDCIFEEGKFNGEKVDFNISVVSYPTIDYRQNVRRLPTSPFVLRNIRIGTNGITPKVLNNIMIDIFKGIRPETYVYNSYCDEYEDKLQNPLKSRDLITNINLCERASDKFIDLYDDLLYEIESTTSGTNFYRNWTSLIFEEDANVDEILGKVQTKYKNELQKYLDALNK